MQDPCASVPAFRPANTDSDLISALDAYEATSTCLVESWFDADAAWAFSKQLDAVRNRAAAMQWLTVLVLQLVIAHCELADTMWQHASGSECAADLDEVRMRHQLAVRALRAAASGLPGTFRPVVELARSCGSDSTRA